jgi:hypothetical protein
MPIPKPHKNEDHNKFVSRCMGDEVMKKDYSDPKQRVAICLSQTKDHSESSTFDHFQTNLLASQASYDDNWDEWTMEIDVDDIWDAETDVIIAKAEETKKQVTLNKPFRTPSGPKKFSVYVKNEKGNVVKVNFGDPNMEIKRDDPARRKSYRARHNCDNPGPKWKANYWSCKMWSKTNVSDLT